MAVLKYDTNNNYLMMLCCNFLSNIGDTWIIFSDTAEEALIGMKVSYIGSAFMCYFMLRVILSACKIKFPKLLNHVVIIVTSITLALAMMIGKNELFYKSSQLIKTDNYSYLVKTYGPLHSIYSIVIFLYMLATLAAAVYALFTPNLVSKSMAFTLALTEAISIIVYFAERKLGLKIDLLPFVKCIMVLLSLYVVRKLYLYDANRVALLINETTHDNGIVLFDKSKRYLGCNTVAREIFEEINDYNVEEVIADRFEQKNFFESIIREFEINEEKYPGNIKRNGEIYRIRVRHLVNERIKSAKGYIIEFVNDTKAQAYIQRINEMNIELEDRAEEANAANQAKSSFLANMSHEIRTPINAVLGLNSVILRDTNEEKTREFARDIDNAGKSLLALINDILDFSKIEAGKMEIVPVEYRTGALITDCQNMLFSRIKEKGLDFKVICNENTPAVLLGDEVRIRQIIINILTNAVKYTESGAITMAVDYEKIDEKKINLSIAVKDTGSGISKENQQHLFESFKRIDETKNRNIEGTGLGLSLVKNLLELMNGEITVESELSKGSTFTVIIPQDVISDEPVGEITQSYDKRLVSIKMDDLSETVGKILVVDDVKVNLKVFVHLLEKSKIDIHVSDSGKDAIEKANKEKYDIIFLDHMMPEMDGIETFHRIRGVEDCINKDTPVVMLTANAIEGIRDMYINEGFDDYLSKPVNFNPLCKIIKNYL